MNNQKINILSCVNFQRKFDEIEVIDGMVSSEVLGKDSYCIAIAGHLEGERIKPKMFWCKAGLGEFSMSEVLSLEDVDDFGYFLGQRLNQLFNFTETDDDDEAFFDTVRSALTDWKMNFYTAGKLHCETGTDYMSISDVPEIKTPEVINYILHRNLMDGSVDVAAGVNYFDFITMMEATGGEWSIKKESIGLACSGPSI